MQRVKRLSLRRELHEQQAHFVHSVVFGNAGHAVCVTGAFSGLTVFGEPTGENLIAGKTAVMASANWSDTLNGGNGSGLTEILDAANLTNGADDQTQLFLPGCSDNPGSGDYAHRAGYTKLYFDLGGSFMR